MLSIVPNLRSPRSTPPPHVTNRPSPRCTPPPQVGVDLNEVQEKVMDNRRPLKRWDATAAFKLMERCHDWLPSLRAHPKYKLLVYWAHERRYRMRFLKKATVSVTCDHPATTLRPPCDHPDHPTLPHPTSRHPLYPTHPTPPHPLHPTRTPPPHPAH